MMKNNSSHYISSNSTVSQKSPLTVFKFVATMLMTLVLGTFFAGSAVSVARMKEAEALDWTQWIMCEVLPDPSKELYQYSQSSDMQYQLRSKSTMNSGVADVESGLNWILNLFGPGFKEVNEGVLGYEINPAERASEAETGDEGSESFNKGTKVNVFDRFGVAGMGYNSYQGEWKHILIDACNVDAEPMDPKAGLYYEERLEPRSTWEYISTSSDARTIQFDRGILVHYWTSIVNVVANAIFWLTKVMVVITIGLISFSLSDIVEILGINEMLGSENGIFNVLFDGIFQPLIFLAFTATAFKIFWDGIVKKQYRASLIVLLRSLFMFFMAFVVAANPAFWMSLPNNAAVFGQSIILTTLSGNLPNSGGLCDTEIGKYDVRTKDVTNIEANINILAESAESMRSAVSCQFWQAFLFRPWVQGQFGTDWKTLWANEKTPEWADEENSAELKNLNSEMVGDAGVPLGDDTFVNNWAIYQLSAQTNVHSATGEDNQGKPSKYTSGVANDWWRIVDALANYEETTKEVELVVGTGVGSGGSTTTSGEYAFPIANPSKSSDFGMRTHPVTGKRTLHAGIDYSAPTGTPLYAVADGTVQTSRSSTGGNIMEVKGVDGWTYRYLHTSAYVASNGDQVTAGQEIAKVGSTGRVTGAHLHFETRSPTNEKIDPNTRLREMGFDPATGSGDGASQTVNPGTGTGTTTKQPYEYGVPKNNPVTPYWDTWVGNNSFGRIFASLSSILIAGVGLAAPLALSAMSAIYAIGVALLMAFSPIFLLLGCWGGKGWDLFKGWGELVVNTTLKRIIVGLLLAITISFTVTALEMIDEVGWFQGMIILVLLSLLVLNSRQKMVNALASIRFAGADLSGTANRIGGIAKQQTIGRAQTLAKDTGRISASAAAGAVGSKYSGGTLREGATAGLKNEFKNLTYRKQSLNQARISYENFKIHGTDQSPEDSEEARIFRGEEQCDSCGKELQYEDKQNQTHLFYGGRTAAGNLLCQECYDDGMLSGQEVYSVQHRYDPIAEKKKSAEAKKKKVENAERNKEAQNLYRAAMIGKTSYTTVSGNASYVQEIQKDLVKNQWEKEDKIIDPETNEKVSVKRTGTLNAESRTKKLVEVASAVKRDIYDFSQKKTEMPPIPDFLADYVSENEIRTAWQHENYAEIITALYTAGALNWYNDQIRFIDNDKDSNKPPRSLNLGAPEEEFQNLLLRVKENKIDKKGK